MKLLVSPARRQRKHSVRVVRWRKRGGFGKEKVRCRARLITNFLGGMKLPFALLRILRLLDDESLSHAYCKGKASAKRGGKTRKRGGEGKGEGNARGCGRHPRAAPFGDYGGCKLPLGSSVWAGALAWSQGRGTGKRGVAARREGGGQGAHLNKAQADEVVARAARVLAQHEMQPTDAADRELLAGERGRWHI